MPIVDGHGARSTATLRLSAPFPSLARNADVTTLDRCHTTPHGSAPHSMFVRQCQTCAFNKRAERACGPHRDRRALGPHHVGIISANLQTCSGRAWCDASHGGNSQPTWLRWCAPSRLVCSPMLDHSFTFLFQMVKTFSVFPFLAPSELFFFVFCFLFSFFLSSSFLLFFSSFFNFLFFFFVSSFRLSSFVLFHLFLLRVRFHVRMLQCSAPLLR